MSIFILHNVFTGLYLQTWLLYFNFSSNDISPVLCSTSMRADSCLKSEALSHSEQRLISYIAKLQITTSESSSKYNRKKLDLRTEAWGTQHHSGVNFPCGNMRNCQLPRSEEIRPRTLRKISVLIYEEQHVKSIWY